MFDEFHGARLATAKLPSKSQMILGQGTGTGQGFTTAPYERLSFEDHFTKGYTY